MYKILHVEDVITDAELVARELKKNDIPFEQCIVDNKYDYDSALDNFSPDIILCDHSLTSFNSLDALKIVQSKKLNIPFILITANISEEVAIKVLKEGAIDYILKDRLKRLPSAVLNAIEKYRFEQERVHLFKEIYEREATAKELLSRLSNKLLLATKAAAVGIWEYDIQTRKFLFDEIMCSQYGLLPYSCEGTYETWINCLHYEDKQMVDQKLQEALIKNTDFNAEFRIITPDNSIRFIICSAVMEKSLNHSAIRLVGTTQDVTERKMAEQVIKESEARYRAFFNYASDGIILSVTDGKILAANPAACKMLQMTEEEVCKKDRFELVDSSDMRLSQFVEQRRRTGMAKSELTFISKDGNRFPVEMTSVTFKDADNQTRTASILRDITESTKAKQTIEESEAKYRAFFETSLDGILLTITDGQILSANPAACRMFKMTEEEICKAGRLGIVDAADPRVTQFLQQRSTYGTANGELTFFRKDGDRFPGEIASTVFTDSNGNQRTSITIRDITVRKNAERIQRITSQSLQYAAGELKKIMDSSLDIICSVNEEGKFVSVSAACETIWGYTVKELKGKKFIDFVYKEDVENTLNVATGVISGTPVSIFENRFVHKNGTVVPLIWSARWDDGNKIMYCIAKDATEKKRLEKALEIERLHFFELFQQAPTHIGVLIGPDHIYEMANPFYLKLIGKKDIIGKKVKEVLPELSDQGFIKLLDEVYQTGQSFSGNEMLVKLFDESEQKFTDVYLNVVYQPYKNTYGTIEGIFFFSVDVTEQVLSRRKIEESKKQYLELIRALPMPTYWCDVEGRILLYNNAAVALWGREPEAGKDAWCGSHKIYSKEGSCLPVNKYPMALAIKDRKAITGEEILIERPDGEMRNVVAHPVLLVDSSGQLTGGVNMLTDITENKAAQHALRESEKNFRQIVETAQEGISVTDENDRTTFVNKKMCEILEYTEEEIINRTNISFKHPEEHEKALQRIELRKKGMKETHEARYVTKSGKIIWAHVSANPVFADDGTYKGTLAMITDITARKEHEFYILKNTEEREALIAELTNSLKDLQQFSFITSHNFKAPLSNLIGFLQIINEDSLTDVNKMIVEMMKASTSQLNETINDLIKTLIIKNNVNVAVADNNVSQVLDEVCTTLMHEIKEINCSVNKDLKVENIYFNKLYLDSILINLISNAIKYRSADRRLVISVSTEKKPNGDVLMIVKDNGIGIDLTLHRNKVFGLYQRFHSNADSRGLGLFIVKSQITALGGSIDVESEVDKGTSFFINFKQSR